VSNNQNNLFYFWTKSLILSQNKYYSKVIHFHNKKVLIWKTGIPQKAKSALKITAAVLFKLFITDNETCNTTDAILRMSGTMFSNLISLQSMMPGEEKNKTTQ